MTVFDRGDRYPRLYYELTGPKPHTTGKTSEAGAPCTHSFQVPTALLIHGLTCDLTDFSFQIPYLHNLGFQTLAFDIRGHGKSSLAPDDKYSPLDIAHDAKALIDHLMSQEQIAPLKKPSPDETAESYNSNGTTGTADQILVIGHSIGAVIGSVFTTLYHNLVSGLVMIDPPFWDVQTATNIQRAYDPINTPDAEVNNVTISSWEARTGGPYAFFEPLTSAEFKDKVLRRIRAQPPPSLRGVILQSLSPDGIAVWENHKRFIEDAGGLKVNRLTVRHFPLGEKVRELGAGADNQISKLSGGGHWPHVAFPEDFNGILRSWIEENGLIFNVTSQSTK